MESLEKSRECFSHRTLASEAPDAAPACSVRSRFLAQVNSEHRMLVSDASQTLFTRPVVHNVSSKFASVSDREHQTPRRVSGGCVW